MGTNTPVPLEKSNPPVRGSVPLAYHVAHAYLPGGMSRSYIEDHRVSNNYIQLCRNKRVTRRGDGKAILRQDLKDRAKDDINKRVKVFFISIFIIKQYGNEKVDLSVNFAEKTVKTEVWHQTL